MATASSRPLQDMLIKLSASRFFTLSLFVHLLLVMLFGSATLYRYYEEPPDFSSSEGEGFVGADSAAGPPEPPAEAMPQNMTPPTPTVSTPAATLSALTTTNPAMQSFTMAPVTPALEVSDSAIKNVAAAAQTLPKGLATGTLPGTMKGRGDAQSRSNAMRKSGGKEKSDKAVLAGLRWLVQQQKPDGSWGEDFPGAMTGFAMLSFLGHGETAASKEFGSTVEKGLNLLIETGEKHAGRLSVTARNWEYQQGIATYSLSEAYTMTKDPRIAPVLKNAASVIINGQSPDGSWAYGFAKPTVGDTSINGWQIQALKATHLSGLEVPGLNECMEKAMLNLKSVRGKQGGFGYNKPDDRYGTTGVAVLCMQFWQQEKNRLAQEAVKGMLDKKPVENNEYKDLIDDGIKFILDGPKVDYKADNADLYAWYYHTQACFMKGGGAWGKWNRMFQDEIVDNQKPEGSWPANAGKGAGAELQGTASVDGDIYRTSLCILMLEIYYRYLPTFAEQGGAS